jgi:hypothetical protein
MALKLSTGVRNAILNGTGGYASTGGFKQLFEDGVLDIYSGVGPANADAVETGSLLVRITVASGACGSGGTGGGTSGTGVGSTGLNFGTAANGSLSKNADVWSGVGLANGEAGWWRFYDTRVCQGANGTAVRMDGVCGVSGADLNMSDLTVALSATITIDSFSITLPAY